MQVFIRFALFSFGVLLFCERGALAQLELPLSAGSSYSNLAVGNLDGNSSNGLEIVAASVDGVLRAYSNSGNLLWQATVPIYGCGSASNRIHSSPATGDLTRDGAADVVIGYGQIGGGGCDGGVAAFNGVSGARLWNFSGKSWAKKNKYGARWFTVFSTPALADTDGDGALEIGFGSFDRNVYLLNANGSVRWFYNAADTIWSSPSFADVNGDRKLELVAATDISANPHLRPPTKNGGNIYAFHAKPRSKKRIYFRDKSAFRWMNSFDQVPYSSPSVGEVLSSNPGAEIVLGSGCYFSGKGKWIKIFSAASGKLLKTIPTGGCSTTSVAIGDIKGDGSVALVHYGPAREGGTAVTAYDPNSAAVLWSTSVGGSPMFQAPIIADIDANGSREILISRGSSVFLFNGANGSKVHCVSSSCREGELRVGGDVGKTTPTVVDLHGDGLPDLLVNTSGSSDPKIVIWNNLSTLFQTVAAQSVNQGSTWPAWRGNSFRSGR